MTSKKSLPKPKYRTMIAVLNQCAKTNMSKAFFAVLVNEILCSLLLSFATIPVVMDLARKNPNPNAQTFELPSVRSFIMTGVLLVIALFFAITLIYGLVVIVARMVEKRRVTLGYLFQGFRERSRVFKASAIFIVLVLLGTAVFVALELFVGNKYAVTITSQVLAQSPEKISSYIIIAMLVYVFIQIIFLLPFVFVWMLVHADSSLRPFKAFVVSARLLFGKVFHFVGFLIYAGGLNLLVLVAVNVIDAFIPQNAQTALQFVSVVLSMVGFVAQYIAKVRMYIAVPIYFYSLTGVMHVHTSENDEPSDDAGHPDDRPEITDITKSGGGSSEEK